jgi:hypothetical protein
MAALSGVSPSAVGRHRKHIAARIRVGTARQDGTAAEQLARDWFDNIAKLQAETQEYLRDAKKAVRFQHTGRDEYTSFRDIAAMAPALSQAHRNAELVGQATKILSDAPSTSGGVQVSIVIPGAGSLRAAVQVKRVEASPSSGSDLLLDEQTIIVDKS